MVVRISCSLENLMIGQFNDRELSDVEGLFRRL